MHYNNYVHKAYFKYIIVRKKKKKQQQLGRILLLFYIIVVSKFNCSEHNIIIDS